jgi:hypothetical protein
MMRARGNKTRCSAHGAGAPALLSEMPKVGEQGIEIHCTGLERAQRFYASSEPSTPRKYSTSQLCSTV